MMSAVITSASIPASRPLQKRRTIYVDMATKKEVLIINRVNGKTTTCRADSSDHSNHSVDIHTKPSLKDASPCHSITSSSASPTSRCSSRSSSTCSTDYPTTNTSEAPRKRLGSLSRYFCGLSTDTT